MNRNLAIISSLLAVANGQLVGTETPETHPPMTWLECTAPDACTEVNGEVVIDANWRWLHLADGIDNCYTDNTWNETACPDNAACAANCALDGADYEGTYGAVASGDSLSLTLVTEGEYSKNIGSRLYMMESEDTYKMYQLLNHEFTFDVDLSGLPCGLNGALYFVSMDADGGLSKYESNKAGAKYGTGYCDAQCPRDLKFINGEGNVEGWVPSDNDANAGVGGHGSCCSEMDVWEANSMGTAYTPHSCDTPGQALCEGEGCGGTYSETRYNGPCDPDGCDFNAYRQGNKEFYGPGLTVDTSKPFTVVTQFLTDTGADDGTLSEIRRYYVQDGVTIPNSQSTIEGVPGDSVQKDFCDAQKEVFGDEYTWEQHGGFAAMSEAMANGMVLVMSIWDDHYANMLWLDSTYPTDADPEAPGKGRGPCPTTSGVPADVEAESPDAKVTFSNIKYGPINSTFAAV
ncbi:hypothetical protein FQN55_001772 [Onygenales sp. PD_40]|nr:hypothetical protein FQN55_001772 [Onygenales sp. PD_40]KAK2759588.1 hypothetical protein FQN53_008022 [Emmonsiellopsis sp. PD_33]KAK2793944.1 hypothetical protein FQN52_000276 [Onygenales sp. PD_12]KAK2800654.1 hypothetical protein FQN51_006037 [Onygenales sp. PD_10]